MYLGLTDGGNSQSGDWNAISSHPRYGEFEHLWLNYDGYADDTNTDPAWLLPQPLVVEGVTYNYVWLTSNGNLYLSEEDENGQWYVDSSDYTPSPGEQGKPSLMPMVSDKICNYAGVRRSPSTLTFRFQAATYDNFDSLDGIASVIWEITFYKPDPEIDADLQFIQFQCSRWDPLQDSYLTQGQVEWSKEFVFGGVNNNQRLFSFPIPNERVIEDAPISYVFTADPDGQIWNFQGDRFLESPCDFIPETTTVAHGHKCDAYSAVVSTTIAHGHSAKLQPSVNLRTFTYNRNSTSARLLPEDRLQGMWPMFFFAHETDRTSSYGAYLGTGNEQAEPYWRNYFQPTSTSAMPNHTPSYYSSRRFSFWQGGSNTSYPLDEAGKLYTNQGTGESYRNFFFVFGGQSPWAYRADHGMPYRFQKGKFMSTITIAENRDKEVYEPYVSRSSSGSPAYTILRWPQPATGEAKNPETGTYIWTRPEMVPYKAAGGGYEESARLAQPFKHGLGKTPTWMIWWYAYSQSYWRHGGQVLYFGGDEEEESNSYNGGAWKYMGSTWPASNQNGHRSNSHFKSSSTICRVDSEHFWITTDVETNQSDEHPLMRNGRANAGLTWHVFADDAQSCVTRYIPIGQAALNEIQEVYIGWRPDVVWTWPYQEQGWQYTYKMIIVAPQEGDERFGDIYAHDITYTTSRRYTTPDAWVQDYDGRFEYQLYDEGIRFRRIKSFDTNRGPEPGEESDFKMFISLQRQAPKPNSQVGQFFLNGYADFTYTGAPGYLSQPGEFVITGQELLKDSGVLPYPPPVLEVGQFVITGQEIGYTYIRWLRLSLETGEFELGGQVAQLIFCCYPDLIGQPTIYTFTGYEAGYTLQRYLALESGEFLLSGDGTLLDYDRFLWIYPEAGEFQLNGYATFSLVRRVFPEAGAFNFTGFDAELAIKNGKLQAEAGEFLITGFDGIALRDPLKAEAGEFLLSGGDAGQQLSDYPFFELEPGAFYLGGGFIEFRRDLRIFPVGYGSFNTFGQEARLTRHQVLSASVGQFQLNGYARLGPAMQAGTGEFFLEGAEAGRNTPAYVLVGDAGQFVLSGQEIGGDVTDVVPLKCEAGAFVLTGSSTTPEQIFPGPFPITTAVGARTEYVSTGRGNALTFNQMPHTPTWLMCIPTNFPLEMRNYQYQDELTTWEHFSQQEGFLPWTITRGIAGVNDAGSWYYKHLRRHQPAIIQSWLSNGILYGPGDVWTGSASSWSGPRDEQNACYNFILPDNEILPEEWRGAPLSYMLLTLQLHHPDLVGDEPSTLDTAADGGRPDPTHKLPNYTGFDDGRDLPIWGQSKERFFEGDTDTQASYTRDELDANWVKWDTWEEALAYTAQQQFENGGLASSLVWGEEERGVSWHYTDQRHGGMAMGAYVLNGVRLRFRQPTTTITNTNEVLQGIKHGLDSKPDLLILQTTNGNDYAGRDEYHHTAIWHRPDWKSMDGVRTDIDRVAAPLRSFFDEEPGDWDPDSPMDPYAWSRAEIWDLWGDHHFRVPAGGEGGNANVNDEDPYTTKSAKQWIALKNTPGHIKVGSYKNAGADTLWVPCTFRPAFVWVMATGGKASGLYHHHRSGDITVDGQTNYTHQIGRLVTASGDQTPDTWGADGWKPSQKGPQSLTFAKGGFYVPLGAIGNDSTEPEQEVTFVAFAHEHWRIQRMTVQPGAFELQGYEIGGRKTDSVFSCEVGEFMVCNSCEAQLIVTRPNTNPRRLIAKPTVFSLRGGFAWGTELVLQAKVGTFVLSGNAKLVLPLRSFLPSPGAFVLNGQQANLREHRLVAEAGRFIANLQWAGGNKPIPIECQVGPKAASDDGWEFEAGREPIQGTGVAARTDKHGVTWTNITEGDLTGRTYSRRYSSSNVYSRYFPAYSNSTTGEYRLCLVSLGYIIFDYYSRYNYTYFDANNPAYAALFLFAGHQSGNGDNQRRNRQYEYRNYTNQIFRGVEGIYAQSYRWEASQYTNSGQLGNSDYVIEVHIIHNSESEALDEFYPNYGKVFVEVRLGRYAPNPFANGDPTRSPGIGMVGEHSYISDWTINESVDDAFANGMTGRMFSDARADRVYLFEMQGSPDSSVNRDECRWTLHVGKEFGQSCDVVLQAEAGGFELTGSESLYLDRPREVLEVGDFVLRGGRNPIFTVSKLAGILQAYEGNFSLSGGEAGGSRSMTLSAGAGAFLMNGRASGGLFEQVLRAETGVVALSGGEVNFLVEAALVAEAGEFLMSSGATELIYRRRLQLQTNVGNYDLFGQAATFSRARTWSVEAGSFALNGRQAGSINDQVVRGWVGSFLLNGQDVGGKKTAIVLNAGPNEVIELEGQDAELRYFREFDPSVAQFLLTGFGSEGLYSRRTVAGSGAFALGGGGATFTYLRKITFEAEAGSFGLFGRASSYRQDQLINAGNGLFVTSGQAAGLYRNQALLSSVGQYQLNGQDAQFLYVRRVVMPAETGNFQLGGQEARLRVLGNTKLQGDVGEFTLNGQQADIEKSITLVAEAGAFELNGEAAGEKQTYRLSAEAGAFELNGQDVVGEFVRMLSAIAGAFQLTGRAAGYIQDQQIGANNGVFLLSGGEAQFTYYRKLKFEVDAGAFVLTGANSEGVYEESGGEYLSSWSRQNYGPLSDARVDGWAGAET